MSGPVLTHISQAAQQLVESVTDAGSGNEDVWHITGRVTAGKSSCLVRAAELLRSADEDAIPLLLNPPARQRDTGAATLVDFGVGLSEHVPLNGGLRTWVEEPQRWRDRLTDARGWIEDHQDRLVLLCDDPTRWGAASEETSFFANRAFDMTRVLLEQARCRRIVAGRVPKSLVPRETIELEPAGLDREWLLDAEDWGDLASAAEQVAESDWPADELTAFDLRLLVALTELSGDVRAALGLNGRQNTHALASRLWDLVAEDQALTRLKRTWLRLAFVRRPFGPGLLECIGVPDLSRRDAAVVRHSLVFGDSERLRLHEVLRSQARTWHREQPRASRQQTEGHAGRLLADYYLGRFKQAAGRDDAEAVVDSMEAFHFVSFAADATLLEQVTPYFTEQLDALGWRLSYVHRRFEQAAAVFRQAIEWDDEDYYAHHYLAFNLDREGQSPREVEQHYLRAIELDPDNSWWHARYIAFLAHRGRIADARRQWDEAQLVLGVTERTSDRFLFETLHLWVADALLDRAELVFASEVLNEVPEWARRPELLPMYSRLRGRLMALQEAAEGRALVPAHRLTERWWETGPELLQDHLGENEDLRLVRWLAARVERLDEDGVHLRAAEIEPGIHAQPEAGALVIPKDAFRRLCRDTGRVQRMEPGWHAEIGIYASQDRPSSQPTTLIRLYEPRFSPWAGESFFDSARYLRTTLPTR